MSEAEAIHRAWVGLAITPIFFALSAIQLWTGKSMMRGGRIITRKKEPGSFWFNVIAMAAIAMMPLGIAAYRLL